jgi:hypothetical protein
MSAHRLNHSRAVQRTRDAEPTTTDYFKVSDYGTRADALEARYALLKHERGEVQRTMAHDAHNEGRGQAPGAASGIAVNATEVRYSARPTVRRNEGYIAANKAWVATEEAPPSELRRDVKYNHRVKFTPPDKWDMSCYSIVAGKRTVFNTPEKEMGKRTVQATSQHDHAGEYAKLVALVGTTVEYD